MKKWFTVLFSILALTGFAQPGMSDYYVSPAGKAHNPGTRERPFATPQQARDAIRKTKRQSPGRAFTVYFREGVYAFAEPFELSEADSGTLEFPIRYMAYPGEKVLFYGGAHLSPADFTLTTNPDILDRLLPEVRGKVLEINLKKAGFANFGVLKQHGFGTIPEPAPLELFINGERQTLARFPNTGILPIGRVYDKGGAPRFGDFSERGAEFGYEYDRPNRWTQAREIWLHGHFSFGYNDDHLQVEKLDTARKSFKIKQPHVYGVMSSLYADTSKWLERVGLSLRGYYAYNLLEEIDQPGEWYLDRETGILYLYPPAGFAEAKVEISIRESPFVQLVRTAHVSFENISFSTARGMGIYLKQAHHIRIDGCTFSNLGTVAISTGQVLQNNDRRYGSDGDPILDQWTSEEFDHIAICNCRIFNTGAGGIILTGGDRQTLRPAWNEIDHCEFYQTDQINHTYSAAVKLFGVGSAITNCYFHDLRHMALGFMGNDHRIEQNIFERTCTEADDMSAIYTGRDPSSRGTRIQYNYFKDILPVDKTSQVGAIFVDDGMGGIEIAHNFFEHAGSPGDEEMFGCIAIHGGYGNAIHHNVFLDCEMAIGNNYWTEDKWKTFLDSPLMHERLHEKVDITSAVYQEKYPELRLISTDSTGRLNSVTYNILINSNMVLQGKLELDHNKIYERANTEKALEKIGFKMPETGPCDKK